MIQPVGKSNTVPSWETDYEKLAQEINAFKEARETKAEKKPRIAKQTSGTLYSNGNNPYGMNKQSIVNFLMNENNVPSPDTVQHPSVDTESYKAKKAEYDFSSNPKMKNSHVMSSVGGENNPAASNKFMKSQTSNSIWDSDKIQRLSESMLPDGGEKIQEEKSSRAQTLKELEQQRMDALADALTSVDQRKSSFIGKLADGYEDSLHNGQIKRNLSIFDFIGENNRDFNNIPEKTAGEKMVEANQSRRDQKDDTWRGGGKSVKVSELENIFLQKLLNQGK